MVGVSNIYGIRHNKITHVQENMFEKNRGSQQISQRLIQKLCLHIVWIELLTLTLFDFESELFVWDRSIIDRGKAALK